MWVPLLRVPIPLLWVAVPLSAMPLVMMMVTKSEPGTPVVMQANKETNATVGRTVADA